MYNVHPLQIFTIKKKKKKKYTIYTVNFHKKVFEKQSKCLKKIKVIKKISLYGVLQFRAARSGVSKPA